MNAMDSHHLLKQHILNDSRRERLIELGPEKLAYSLLEAAISNPRINELVDRLSSDKRDNLKKYYEGLERLQRQERYYEWRDREIFIARLNDLLKLLEDGASSPEEGIKGIFALYETDGDICESCHDDGEIGMFFEYDVCDLLIRFSSDCDDHDWIADEAMRLFRYDNYGCRDCLIERASEYLQEAQLRQMIKELEKPSADNKGYWKSCIKKLAAQLKDQELLESLWRESASGELPEEGVAELAELCFENNETGKALAWLEKLPEDSSYDYLKDELLEKIHRKNGDKEKLSIILFAKFKERRSFDILQELLEVIGEDQREEIIKKEAETIFNIPRFDADDLAFLLDCDMINKAAEYVFKHAKTITGEDYYPLCKTAEKLSKSEQPLAAAILYRALLDSILDQAYSRAYKHAVKYLTQLDALTRQIDNWNGFKTHEDYLAELQEKHKRKHGFWGRYEDSQNFT
jgi:hypothetical protein